MNIAGIAASAALKTVEALVDTEESSEEVVPQQEAQESSTPESFADALSKILGKGMADTVNEEELFAAAIEQKLAGQSEEAATYFSEQKGRLMSDMARSDGYVSVEEVAKAALNATVAAGHIDQATAQSIQSESFRAAQLDDNLNALYDGRGSAEDQTVAVSSMEEALLKMSTALEQLESGEIEAPTDIAEGLNKTQELDGSGGFLWKPESESDGNLVVLLPTELRDLIDKVEIHSELPATADTLLEEGRFTGDEDNGERLHYRFNGPGSEYGENVHLVAYHSDGSTLSWAISNGAERQD